MTIDYTKLTERCRQVFTRANRHAQEIGHEYVGCEHILLALLDDPGSVATMVIRERCDLSELHNAIKKAITTTEPIVSVGKLPMTPRNKRVVELAFLCATRYGHAFVGPEHLLAGLVEDNENIASSILAPKGIDADYVAHRYAELFGNGVGSLDSVRVAKNVLLGLVHYHDTLLTVCDETTHGVRSSLTYLSQSVRWLSEHVRKHETQAVHTTATRPD